MKTGLRAVTAGLLVATFFLISASGAWAIDCASRVSAAETAAENASADMNAAEKALTKGRALILIDESRMYLASAKRLCSRANASKVTQARALAQATAAFGFAEAASALVKASEE